MSQKAAELALLPKDSLINLAAGKISEPLFDLKDFDRVEIWLDGDDLNVEFDHNIRFIPRKGQFYYGATVNLVTGSTSYYIKGEGPWDEEVKFYKPLKFRQEIKFVLDAINNSDGEVGKIPDGQLPDGTMNINEKPGYYDVTVDSESTHSYYKIKKGNGKIYDAGHKHYAHYGEPSERKRIY